MRFSPLTMTAMTAWIAGDSAGAFKAFISVETSATSQRRQQKGLSLHDGLDPMPQDNRLAIENQQAIVDRRNFLLSSFGAMTITSFAPLTVLAEDDANGESEPPLTPVQLVPSSDAKKFFNEARTLEAQGNILGAQRSYAKVTKIDPRFVYGWSNLGNTQIATGAVQPAEVSYTKAIDLCRESMKAKKPCGDLYVIYLNRGSLRLNNKLYKEALQDLELADELKGSADAVILRNRARARELNGQYAGAERDYSVAMTSSQVAPFWIRAALMKFQMGDEAGAFQLLKRVDARFSEAPEVRAAYAAMLASQGEQEAAQHKYLEMPDRQRLKFADDDYMKNTMSWPPAMIENLKKVSSVVDLASGEE